MKEGGELKQKAKEQRYSARAKVLGRNTDGMEFSKGLRICLKNCLNKCLIPLQNSQ